MSSLTPFALIGWVTSDHTGFVVADSVFELSSPAPARPDRVDVSGSTYDVDRPPAGQHVPRCATARWQGDRYRYLMSCTAEIMIRHATGISPSTTRRLNRLPAIASVAERTIRRVP